MNFKKFFAITILSTFAVNTTFGVANEDNQIVDNLLGESVKELNFDFKMQTFDSCKAIPEVMSKYIKEERRPYYKFGVLENNAVDFDGGMDMMDDAVTTSEAQGAGEDFSETNTQVFGVDESEIVKTDGKKVFYYNEDKKAVFVLEKDGDDLNVIKKINIPKQFWGVQMYLANNKLVILASGNTNNNFNKPYYFNRNLKTYSIIYDISDIKSIKLEKIDVTDGSLSNSRRIGDTLYVLSNNHYSYPYYYNDKFEPTVDSFVPRTMSIYKTDDSEKQNLKIKNKQYPYNVTAGKADDCNNISYIVPDEDTLDNYSFSPSYTTISAINLKDVDTETENKVLMGDIREVYMSLDNLYITSQMYTESRFSCPPGAYCIMPWYPRGTNTAIHKFEIDKQNIKYANSNIVEGTPLTQYSMDEYKGNFRIITQSRGEKRHTNVFVLNKDLKLEGKINEIAPGEDFKSSRFMGDKLYLVTFEQVDPLFVIDMKDAKNPKILGELKIPGYSTYLHPYDENHLIGLGYDTKENEYGGVYNNGVKIDLYDVSDFKNPKQKFTLTVGERGSYSEALNNPRMFVWDKNRKTLLIPARIQNNEEANNYKAKDYFNGVISFEIDKDKGIKEKGRITHISTEGLKEKRDTECEKYLQNIKKETECKTLINGQTYCPRNNYYVPNYCYEDSTLEQFIADKSWEFRNDNIKRVIYIGNDIISLSDNTATSHDFNTIKLLSSASFKNKEDK